MNPSVQDHFAQNNDIIIIMILFYLLLPVVWLIVAKNSTICS